MTFLFDRTFYGIVFAEHFKEVLTFKIPTLVPLRLFYFYTLIFLVALLSLRQDQMEKGQFVGNCIEVL